MGIQEMLYGVGMLVLLGALIYGATRAGRRTSTPAGDAATRKLYDTDAKTGKPLPKSQQRGEPGSGRAA